MKTIPVSFLLAGMLVPVVCHAQPQGAPAGPPAAENRERKPAPKPFVEIWNKVDLNSDGFLSKAEFDAMPRMANLPEEKRTAIFKRLDKDGDDKLSHEELGRFGKPHDGEGPPAKRLWELDTNKSGGVDIEEFKKGQLFKKLPPEKLDEVFHRLDTDGDGVITPKDQPKDRPKRPEGGEPAAPDHINRKLDLNQDGGLSFEEFRAGSAMKGLTEDEQEDRFEMLDRNGDHKLTPEDFPKPPEAPKPPDAPATVPAPETKPMN
jgi:Ca2+-binding EF-hand superfamily protein